MPDMILQTVTFSTLKFENTPSSKLLTLAMLGNVEGLFVTRKSAGIRPLKGEGVHTSPLTYHQRCSLKHSYSEGVYLLERWVNNASQVA